VTATPAVRPSASTVAFQPHGEVFNARALQSLSSAGGFQNSSVPQPSPSPAVVPSNKLAKIEPRQTAIAWIATNNSTGQTCVASVPKTQVVRGVLYHTIFALIDL